MTSEILGDGLELSRYHGITPTNHCIIKAMVDVILDQGAFGLLHGFLHRLKLLRDIQARMLFLDHPDNACEVTVGAFQPLHDSGVDSMMGWV